ncbi:MAG: sulfatase activating formylglycine-generating enzyme, partial [Candidatus Promineifilaceae bacterium]
LNNCKASALNSSVYFRFLLLITSCIFEQLWLFCDSTFSSICHSTKDGEFAGQLAEVLRVEGWLVWIAPESIAAGEKWVDAIQRGLDESGIFMLLISPHAVASQWVKSETNAAIGLEHMGDMRIVPLLYKPAKSPSLWSNYQSVLCKAISAQSLNNLFQALELERPKPTISKKRSPAQGPVQKEPEPKAKKESTNFAMMFVAAEKAYEIGAVHEARKLFEQICDLDQNGVWAKNASGEIEKIEAERVEKAFKEGRLAKYERVKDVVPQSKRAGQIAWEAFKQAFADFDPDDIAKTFVPPKPKFALPDPFEWIEIPKKGYSISKYPITNAQFGAFINDKGYQTDQWWTGEGLKFRNVNEWTEARYFQDSEWNGHNHPVVGVSWFEAVAFCNWLSEKQGQKIMLPTDEQWQYAGQGDASRKFPWGDTWDDSKCNNNVDGNGVGKTTPVTQFEGKGDSPFGVVDMSGNVWEWCLTDYDKKTNDVDATAKYRVLRGGSWGSNNGEDFAVSFRNRNETDDRNFNLGFRVALSS